MEIPPMLLVPFFENVFKHGNLENLKEGWMKAYIDANEKQLMLKVSNTFSMDKAGVIPGGIGLENVRQRLDLLFPNHNDLEISDNGKVFSTQMVIHWMTETVA